MKPGSFAIVLVCALAVSMNAVAQTAPKKSAAAVLEDAKKRASEMDQLRAGLRSPDSSVRISTFSAMVESGDPSLEEIALGEAIVSSDAAIKNLAFKHAFRNIRALAFTADSDMRVAGSGQQMFQSAYAGASIESYNAQTGTFESRSWRVSGTYGVGRIAGNAIDISSSLCKGNLLNVEGTWTFKGRIECAAGDNIMRVTVSTALRG
jgi:hypothetical protein